MILHHRTQADILLPPTGFDTHSWVSCHPCICDTVNMLWIITPNHTGAPVAGTIGPLTIDAWVWLLQSFVICEHIR